MGFIKYFRNKTWIDWVKIIVAIDIASVGIGLIIGINFHIIANLLGFISRIFFGILYVFVSVLILKRVFPTVLHVDGNDELEKGNVNYDIKNLISFLRKKFNKIIIFTNKILEKIDIFLDKIEFFIKNKKEEIKREIKGGYMSSDDIRSRFLTFFKKRNHSIIESSSVIAEQVDGETNSTLFNTAGMQPLIPYLIGKEHPSGNRLAGVQKCIRTIDIDEVGDNTHVSFFEMLGNWSLGDYFKKDSIRLSWEFLTNKKDGLGFDPKRIFVTVFGGGEIDGKEIALDKESVSIWEEILKENKLNPKKRIFYKLKDNWWSAGDNSPCGTTTEIFYDLSGSFIHGLSQDEFERFEEKQEIVEIWNNVFMEYLKENGKVVGFLSKKNVDTGAGLERLASVMQNVSSIAETDLFFPLINIIKQNSKSFSTYEARIIADHIKTSIFMIFDGVKPSNNGHGYVLRKIIRRSVNNIKIIDFDIKSLDILIKKVFEIYDDVYHLNLKGEFIINIINSEVDKYLMLIKKGEKTLSHILLSKNIQLNGKLIAKLEQTNGIPFDLIKSISKKLGFNIDKSSIDEYLKLKKEHKEKSRKAGIKRFKGGLAEDTPKIRALHTVTHLMLAGLRKYLGDDVYQKGSNITEERTRFDFTYNSKVPNDILDSVENYVNNIINSNSIVLTKTMKKEEAKKSGVVGSFWEKYPDDVLVYIIKDNKGNIYSKELCGGPHVEKLSDVALFGKFKIKKEESSSAGVRRIKAVLE